MKFTSIPDNGSSWGSELIYEVETEETNSTTLVVDIRDIDRNMSLGRCYIYGVVKARFDIAPYLRSEEEPLLPATDEPTISISPSARRIGVMVNGYSSEERRFFRAKVDMSKPALLSTIATEQHIERGELIRLTAYGRQEVEIVVTQRTPSGNRHSYLSQRTYGMPVEITIPTASFDATAESVEIVVMCDDDPLASLHYRFVSRSSSAYRLAWLNGCGGVECYTFAHSSHRCCRTAELATRYGAAAIEGCVEYELCSAAERSEEMERLAEVVFSPLHYRLVGGELRRVELLSREVAFDEHDRLHRLVITVREPREGASLC